MRELTDSEQEALNKARQEYEPAYVGYSIEELAGLEAGFIVGRDTATSQIADLQAENKCLREALFKDTKTLKRLARGWRDYANGRYCQNYNLGMAEGLNSAADTLEEYVIEARRALSDPPTT